MKLKLRIFFCCHAYTGFTQNKEKIFSFFNQMFFLWLHVCTVFISFFILFYFFTIIIIASPVILSFHSYLKLQNRKHSVSVKLILIKSKHFPSLRRENVFLFSKGHLKKSYPYLFTPPPVENRSYMLSLYVAPARSSRPCNEGLMLSISFAFSGRSSAGRELDLRR